MNKTSIKKNTIYNAMKTFSSIVFPLITFPYVSRVLLVENIGKVSFGLSFVSYFSLMASLGISVYAIRECSKLSDNREKLSKTASQIFSLNVFTTSLSYFILILFLIFYKKIENYRVLIVIQSISILFSTLGTDWLNTAMEDFKYIALRTFAFQFLSLGLLFTFIHKPEDYLKYAAINVISSSGYNILNIFYRKRYCDIRFTTDLDIKRHYLPIIYLFVMLMSQTIFNNVDMTMLGVMKGDYSVGIYSTAHKISNIINQVVASILWVVIPRISYYFGKNDFAEINKLLRKILRFNITLGLPCAVGTILMSTDIIRLIAGEEFIQSSIVFKSAIACYNFIQRYDFVGAAITTVFCSLLILIMAFLKIDSRIRINNIISLFVQPIIGCLFITIICFAGYKIDNYIIRICFAIPISILTYFGIQLIFKNELCIEFVKSITRKVFNVK